MKKIFLLTTISVVVLFFIPFNVSANNIVVINEICWMGSDFSVHDEWIELYNLSSSSINLSGWKVEANDGSPIIELSGTIPARGYFLLERTDDDSVPEIKADQIYTGALSNSGEYLKLIDNKNSLSDEVDATEGWPAGDNLKKQTMEKIDDDWQTSLSPGGTPKTENSSGATDKLREDKESKEDEEGEREEKDEEEESEAPSVSTDNNLPIANAGDSIIAFVNQEIVFNGEESSDPDNDELAYSWNMGNGKLIEEKSFVYQFSYPGTYLVTLMVYDGQYYASDTITVKIRPQKITINEFIPNPRGKDAEKEWIEIYNDSGSIVDISGWQLDDCEGGSNPFILPENTLIAPNSYLVFPRSITHIALNNTSDSVRLLMPEGIVFQEVSYQENTEGMSSSRTDQGFIWSIPTPGQINIAGSLKVVNQDKNIKYQDPVQPERVKKTTVDYSWNYQNNPDQDIEGGYAFVAQPERLENNIVSEAPIINQDDQENADKLQTATAREGLIKSNPLGLIIAILAIVCGGLLIGLILIKLLKKDH